MTSNKKKGIDDIVAEGGRILKECREWVKDKYGSIESIRTIYTSLMTDEDYENLHKKMINDHHDFASIYAIVIRHIVMHNEYFDDVMRKYVLYLTNNPWKNKKEFIERQGEYLIYTEKHKNPRMGTSQLARYREYVRRQLSEEEEKFDKYAEEVTETVNKEWDDIIVNRKKRLYDMLVDLKKN